jgi:hypothetical protein
MFMPHDPDKPSRLVEFAEVGVIPTGREMHKVQHTAASVMIRSPMFASNRARTPMGMVAFSG